MMNWSLINPIKLFKKATPSEKIEFIAIFLIAGVFLVAFILAFPQGADNSMVVRYWNNDDANILTNYGFLYKKLVLMPVDFIGYPFFFYYLSGLSVLPMALFFGPNPQSVLFGWRLFNILSFFGIFILLFYISRHYLKLRWAGTLSSLILGTTYVVLFFVVSTKPHTLEILINLLVLILCYELFNKFDLKRLVLAALFVGFSFSTKYHGVFFFPVVYSVLLLHFWTLRTSLNQSKALLFRGAMISFVLMLGAASMFALFQNFSAHSSVWLDRFQHSFLAKRVFDSFIVHHLRDFSVFFLIGAAALFVFEIFAYLIEKKSKKIAQKGLMPAIQSVALANYYMFVFIGVFSIVAVITNPYIFVYPQETIDVFFRMYQLVYDGTGWSGGGFGSPFEWFQVITSKKVLGYAAASLFVFYVLFEVALIKYKQIGRESRAFRFVCLAHIIFYFGYVFFRVGLRKGTYVVPILPEVVILSSFAAVSAIQLIPKKSMQRVACFVLIGILGFGVFEKWEGLKALWNNNTKKNSDQGYLLATQINKNYPNDISVISDSLGIAYMIEKEQVARGAWRNYSEKMLDLKDRFNPDLIILTLEENIELIEQLKNEYKVVQSEDYEGYNIDDVTHITLLEKNAL